MSIKCGIVGLPNVGKSTLFNAITKSNKAEAANYPFCTIEPNCGMVPVRDKRLENLAKLANSSKIIYNYLEFVDIAGLVKGASQGEGLGNKFLSHIREVDAIIHVLRCFEDEDIRHVHGKVDPIFDADVVETELILADIESIEKRLPALEKKAKNSDKDAVLCVDLLQKALANLNNGKVAGLSEHLPNVRSLNLLTTKPVLYLCNVSDKDILSGNALSIAVNKMAKTKGAQSITVSAQLEAEILALSEGDRMDFLEEYGMIESGMDAVTAETYRLLNMITFFTVGPKEARAWSLLNGSPAPKAAGVIHSDFEKGFIRAETISYEDYLKFESEAKCRELGKIRSEGKEYVIQDGDVVHFRFNV